MVPDITGHYKVQLGASFSSGIPLDLFSSGEARWLEVQIVGQPSQPRVLLASVPYALKAADATTLGGLPASAYALAGTKSAASADSPAITPDAVTTVTTTGGTAGYIPEFSGASTIVDSPVFVSGANVGIGTSTPSQTLDVNGPAAFRGNANFFWKGSAHASGGANSSALTFGAETYDSSTASVIRPFFSLLAESAGNNTASPSATLNVQYSNGTTLAETGLHINANGTINFAPGQTFAGTGVTGSISATTVNANSYDLGGLPFAFGSQGSSNVFLGFAGNSSTTGFDNTASGFHALNSNTSSSYNTANGAYTLFGNTTGTDNTASGALALYANTTGSDNTASGFFAMYQNTSGVQNAAYGSHALEFNTTGDYNTASGYYALRSNADGISDTASGEYALTLNTSGSANTASGQSALYENTTGSYNTAYGYGTLSYNTTGINNTAIGGFAGETYDQSDITGSFNTVVGYEAALGTGTLTNATAIGALAVATESYTVILGCIAGSNYYICPNGVNVGIGTTTPDNLLTVNGKADKPGGGSWGTYSDGRLKTVNGSFGSGLDQVMKLHPIRYRYKPDNALGIRDAEEHIGVVAQDVQRVIPEAVTENAKGYLLVDNDPIIWSMVNAIKEQQRQIEQQQKLLLAQSSMLRTLQAQVRDTRKTLRQVKAQSAATQPTMIAAR